MSVYIDPASVLYTTTIAIAAIYMQGSVLGLEALKPLSQLPCISVLSTGSPFYQYSV